MGSLSAHFGLEEFTASPTARARGIDNTPNADIITNLLRLASRLETVRSAWGNLALSVLSGYRCPDLNKAVGGVPDSYHQYGCAADIHPPIGMDYPTAKQLIVDADVVFDKALEEQAGDGGHWIHFQVELPGARPRQQVLTAQVDHTGGTITRVTVG